MRLAAIFALAAGCATSGQSVHVALVVQGSAAGAAEEQRCVEAATRAGAIIDPQAPVQALVTLEAKSGQLQVLSTSRGLVREESLAAGSVETLCRDAALAAAAAHAAPTLSNDPNAVGGAPSPNPQPTPSTSGAANRGPISN
jgi:hypothetical protein